MGLFPFVAGSNPYGVAYADQLPARSSGLTSGTGKTGLLAAVANRNNVRVDIPVIGDSVTEGQGATAFGNRWVAQANRAVRDAYPTTANGASGGLGFIPIASTGTTGFTWPVALSSGSVGTLLDLGPVRQSGGFTTSTAVWTWTAPAGTTSVRVCDFDGSTPGGYTYQVNSGTITSVPTASTLLDRFSVLIPITSGQVLTIRATASGNCFVTGIIHYAGDETSGITFHGCGRFGWCAGTEAGIGWNVPEQNSLDWAQTYVTAFPSTQALGIMLGINDSNPAVGNRTGPQYTGDVAGLITTLRTAGSPLNLLPLLLIAEYSPNITTADAGGWASYVAAARSVAATDGNASVIDLSYRMPTVASGFLGGELYADQFHPTNLGHALIGEIVAAGVRVA